MRNLENLPEMCQLCPNKGSFVGPITEDTTIESSLTVNGCITIQFVDEDGMSSRKISANPDVLLEPIHNRKGKETGQKLRDNAETTATEMVEASKSKIISRVARCSGAAANNAFFAAQYAVECPALNSDVLEHLLQPE